MPASDVEAEGIGVEVALGVIIPDIVIESDGPAVAIAAAERLASAVKDADRPVAFLQLGGVEVALPVTKLIAAHCIHQ